MLSDTILINQTFIFIIYGGIIFQPYISPYNYMKIALLLEDDRFEIKITKNKS